MHRTCAKSTGCTGSNARGWPTDSGRFDRMAERADLGSRFFVNPGSFFTTILDRSSSVVDWIGKRKLNNVELCGKIRLDHMVFYRPYWIRGQSPSSKFSSSRSKFWLNRHSSMIFCQYWFILHNNPWSQCDCHRLYGTTKKFMVRAAAPYISRAFGILPTVLYLSALHLCSKKSAHDSPLAGEFHTGRFSRLFAIVNVKPSRIR